MRHLRWRLGMSLGKMAGIIVLIVGALFVLSFGVMVKSANDERSRRIHCASNLRQIGQALALYSFDFKTYPRMRWDRSKPALTTPDGRGARAESQVQPNDPMAAMFLLVKHSGLNTQPFVCPGSDKRWDTMDFARREARFTFTSLDNVSYSITNPYPSKAAIQFGYKWARSAPADFAVAADGNDGTRNPAVMATSPAAQQRELNSRNHRRGGQNVLYSDGHVDWHQTAWAGANRDNIYTSAKAAPAGGALDQVPPTDPTKFPEPGWQLDTVLIPVYPKR